MVFVMRWFVLTQLILLVSGAGLHRTWADEVSQRRLKLIFEQQFYSQYEQGKCGDNILGLLREAQAQKLPLDGARIIQIQNKGFTVFGLVNAEWVREAGRLIPGLPANERRYEVGERNWYHHVILYYEGLIFDFDFGNEPRVISVQDYFEQMFLNEKRNPDSRGTYVGREEKLKNYELALSNPSRPSVPESVLSLGHFLGRF